jgi:hypothetical protein
MAMGQCLEIGVIIHEAKPLTYQSALERSLSNTMVTGYLTIFKEEKNRLNARANHEFALRRN